MAHDYIVQIYHSALLDAATSLLVGFVEDKNVTDTQCEAIRLEIVCEQFGQSAQKKGRVFSSVQLKDQSKIKKTK